MFAPAAAHRPAVTCPRGVKRHVTNSRLSTPDSVSLAMQVLSFVVRSACTCARVLWFVSCCAITWWLILSRVLATQVAGPEPTEAQRTSQVRATVTRKIQTLGRQKRPKEAVSQLAEMARLGVQPDTQAATALIDACVRNRKMDMAQRVFEELFGVSVIHLLHFECDAQTCMWSILVVSMP